MSRPPARSLDATQHADPAVAARHDAGGDEGDGTVLGSARQAHGCRVRHGAVSYKHQAIDVDVDRELDQDLHQSAVATEARLIELARIDAALMPQDAVNQGVRLIRRPFLAGGEWRADGQS